MAKLPSKWVTTFEFPDGTTRDYYSPERIRGCRSSGERPAYAVLTCITPEEGMDFEALQHIRKYIFMDIANVLSHGGMKGRVILKPLWLHHLINDRS